MMLISFLTQAGVLTSLMQYLAPQKTFLLKNMNVGCIIGDDNNLYNFKISDSEKSEIANH
jgi:hypothetical protein